MKQFGGEITSGANWNNHEDPPSLKYESMNPKELYMEFKKEILYRR